MITGDSYRIYDVGDILKSEIDFKSWHFGSATTKVICTPNNRTKIRLFDKKSNNNF